MPVTQSAIMKFPLPGAALTDNRIGDLVAIREALLALDNKWVAFKKVNDLKPGIISVDSDKLIYQINEQIVVTITTKNIPNDTGIFYFDYKLIPGTYYDVSGFSVWDQGLSNISDNVYQITYAFYDSDTVNVFENFTFKLGAYFYLDNKLLSIKYASDITITAITAIPDTELKILSVTTDKTTYDTIENIIVTINTRSAIDINSLTINNSEYLPYNVTNTEIINSNKYIFTLTPNNIEPYISITLITSIIVTDNKEHFSEPIIIKTIDALNEPPSILLIYNDSPFKPAGLIGTGVGVHDVKYTITVLTNNVNLSMLSLVLDPNWVPSNLLTSFNYTDITGSGDKYTWTVIGGTTTSKHPSPALLYLNGVSKSNGILFVADTTNYV